MVAFWAVELVGDSADLVEFERVLDPNFDPRIHRVNGKPALRSAELEALTGAQDVRDRARGLIDVLNGAVVLLRAADPVRPGAVFRVKDDGGVDTTVFADLSLRLRAVVLSGTVVIRDADGNIVPPPPPTANKAQVWAQAAVADDDIADLLTFLGRANNWFDLYKAIEMAEKLVGGEHTLQNMLGSTGTSFKNARTTANWHRHARGHKPTAPATFDEALTLVKFAANLALEAKT
ncbi:MAG: hypothetical protein JNM47_08795 [Hyphomonadaceae bacterium]|nr:hypothetical protein [Hyphomonadaceae bacterium]